MSKYFLCYLIKRIIRWISSSQKKTFHFFVDKSIIILKNTISILILCNSDFPFPFLSFPFLSSLFLFQYFFLLDLRANIYYNKENLKFAEISFRLDNKIIITRYLLNLPEDLARSLSSRL